MLQILTGPCKWEVDLLYVCYGSKLVPVQSLVEYFVYFADRRCTPSRVSFVPLSTKAKYKKLALFSKPVINNDILLVFYETLT